MCQWNNGAKGTEISENDDMVMLQNSVCISDQTPVNGMNVEMYGHSFLT
jgi:hypothetical protein